MKKKKNENIEFLNYIYKNAEMGVIGIDDVITKVDDEKFIKLLKIQREEYKTCLGFITSWKSCSSY